MVLRPNLLKVTKVSPACQSMQTRFFSVLWSGTETISAVQSGAQSMGCPQILVNITRSPVEVTQRDEIMIKYFRQPFTGLWIFVLPMSPQNLWGVKIVHM
jgi:hypothetical protein